MVSRHLGHLIYVELPIKHRIKDKKLPVPLIPIISALTAGGTLVQYATGGISTLGSGRQLDDWSA
jgi:hypothetical protein